MLQIIKKYAECIWVIATFLFDEFIMSYNVGKCTQLFMWVKGYNKNQHIFYNSDKRVITNNKSKSKKTGSQ